MAFERAVIAMIMNMCGVSLKYNMTSESLRKLVGMSLSQLSLKVPVWDGMDMW